MRVRIEYQSILHWGWSKIGQASWSKVLDQFGRKSLYDFYIIWDMVKENGKGRRTKDTPNGVKENIYIYLRLMYNNVKALLDKREFINSWLNI